MSVDQANLIISAIHSEDKHSGFLGN